MSRQKEAWDAWVAGAPTPDPHSPTMGGYASDPRVSQALLSERVPGTRAFGPGRPEAPRDGTRPAAVRVPVSPPRTRRGARPGTRRKVRRRDPLLGARLAWALTRIAMGFVFLWVFADRLAGFGKPVPSPRSWLNGGSPTRGYLLSADGPFAVYFQAMAGNVWVDGLFMLGMGGVGLALVLGIGMRVAAVAGSALLVLIYLSALPVEANPFLDQHLVYALVLVTLALSRAGDTIGLGAWWSRTRLVRGIPALR